MLYSIKESRSGMETLKGVPSAMRSVKDWVKGSKDEELAMVGSVNDILVTLRVKLL